MYYLSSFKLKLVHNWQINGQINRQTNFICFFTRKFFSCRIGRNRESSLFIVRNITMLRHSIVKSSLTISLNLLNLISPIYYINIYFSHNSKKVYFTPVFCKNYAHFENLIFAGSISPCDGNPRGSRHDSFTRSLTHPG